MEKDEGGRKHILYELTAIKKQYKIYDKRVLELGCGGGANLMCFSSENEVFGIDGLESAAELARERGVKVSQANLDMDFEFSEREVDWVLLVDVLEHLQYPEKLLKRVHEVLSQNGRVIINVPNHFNLSGRIKLLFGKDLDVGNFFPDHDEWNNPHIRFFTFKGIKRLANVSGYKVIEDRSSHFPAVPLLTGILPVSVSRIIAKIAPNLFTTSYFLVLSRMRG